MSYTSSIILNGSRKFELLPLDEDKKNEDEKTPNIGSLVPFQGNSSILNSPKAHYYRQQHSTDLINYQKFRTALASVLFFFRPPKDETFYDGDSQKTYQRPDHSQLLFLVGDYFDKNGYKRFGLNRNKLLVRPLEKTKTRCDILYFIKHDSQIKYESGSWMWRALSYFIESTIKKQKAILGQLKKDLPPLVRGWKYGEYYFCTSEELKRFCFKIEDVKSMHAIVFFYKEV